jgi:hypothetical protein
MYNAQTNSAITTIVIINEAVLWSTLDFMMYKCNGWLCDKFTKLISNSEMGRKMAVDSLERTAKEMRKMKKQVILSFAA